MNIEIGDCVRILATDDRAAQLGIVAKVLLSGVDVTVASGLQYCLHFLGVELVAKP
jgi:hypothetical protein